jgi:hypothetical protein
MRTFIDNVANLVIEQCLIDSITGILTPKKVLEMSNETLEKLGSESQNTQDYRKTLLNRVETLEEARKICTVNSSKNGSRKCLSSFNSSVGLWTGSLGLGIVSYS